MGERLLDAVQAAERLGVCTRQVAKLWRSGAMPIPVRLGRSVRWRERDLDQWIEAGCPRIEVGAAGKGRAGG